LGLGDEGLDTDFFVNEGTTMDLKNFLRIIWTDYGGPLRAKDDVFKFRLGVTLIYP